MNNAPQAKELLAAAAAADRAAEATDPEEQARAVMQVFAHKEAVKLALMQQQLNRVAENHRYQERLPLCVDGDPFGRVEARIPKDLFFHLQQQKNFGWDGFADDGGMRDFLKSHPQCRVNTISGKTTVGYGSKRSGAPTRRVLFGRGTMNFAT